MSKISVKWHLFAYIAAFTAVMLLLLWLFQVVFLRSFYRVIKINDIKTTANSIEANISRSDLQSYLMNVAHKSDSVISITDLNGTQKYSSYPPNVTAKTDAENTKKLIQKAQNGGGTYTQWLDRTSLGDPGADAAANKNSAKPSGNAALNNTAPNNTTPGNTMQGSNPPHGNANSIVYIKIVQLSSTEKAAVIISADIAPIDATVMTIRTQLICVTIVMLVLALLLALLMSKRISKPIVKMNSSAKELAHGNYGISFDGKGYKEIYELGGSLNYAARELGKTENLRRELIANISHDLRTPLTMIAGYAEVIRDIPGENTPENVQVIIDEVGRLSSLVTDVLDLSKIESSTEEMKNEPFNLTESIGSILCRYKKLTEQDGFTIKFLHEGDVWVDGDELRISQVVYNLVNNAITHTGKDKLVVVRQLVSEDRVKIEVIDTGEGIPADKLPMIWDRYYKVDKQYKRAATGSGLGLSIVKTILEKHNALYGVQSTVNEGSVFWFELDTVPEAEQNQQDY